MRSRYPGPGYPLCNCYCVIVVCNLVRNATDNDVSSHTQNTFLSTPSPPDIVNNNNNRRLVTLDQILHQILFSPSLQLQLYLVTNTVVLLEISDNIWLIGHRGMRGLQKRKNSRLCVPRFIYAEGWCANHLPSTDYVICL